MSEDRAEKPVVKADPVIAVHPSAEVPKSEEPRNDSATAESAAATHTVDDSDPDLDDLDDVLDQFDVSAAKPAAAAAAAAPEPVPAASGPGRTTADDEALVNQLLKDSSAAQSADLKGPEQLPDESEEQFMQRLTSEMSTIFQSMSPDASKNEAQASAEDVATMGKELDEFTRAMEKDGVQPEDLLKAILGVQQGRKVSDAAKEVRDGSQDPSSKREASIAGKSSFEDTIRRTMERMEKSDTSATNATAESGQKSEEDMLADLLKAMETEGGGNEGDLSKMFMGMMEQLTNKEMLYEPMKELDDKFPDWLKKNKSKLSKEDLTRFTNQRVIVREITAKFEEKDYSDEDPQCREFVWERMQKMQNEGSPPEDLIATPLPGLGSMPGMGGGEDAQCPTQ